MPKVVGIEIGRHEVVAVEVDGSPRRFKVTGVAVMPLSAIHPEDAPEVAPKDKDLNAKDQAAPTLVEGWGISSMEMTRLLTSLFKRYRMSRENTALAFPARQAVVRSMTLPFRGVDQIRKVIKFESESQFHTHSAEDMVVDFHVLRETDAATDMLVFAVPKPILKGQLLALARAGVEPEIVNLDNIALFRCAEALGGFRGEAPRPSRKDDDAPIPEIEPEPEPEPASKADAEAKARAGEETFVLLEDDDAKGGKGVKTSKSPAAGKPAADAGKPATEAKLPATTPEVATRTGPMTRANDPNRAMTRVGNPDATVNHLLISVGADCSEILVVRDGGLSATRTLRLGIDSIGEAIGRYYSLTPAQGRQALDAWLTGRDSGPVLQDAVPVSVESGKVGEPGPVPDVLPPSVQVEEKTVFQECARFHQRFVRELIRFLSGVQLPGGISKVQLTGRGSMIPGLKEAVSAALSVAVEDFSPLGLADHTLSDEEVRGSERLCGVALGVALQMLGVVKSLDFRQEDLAFARKFDRIKFPLAIVCMLAALMALMGDMFLLNKVQELEMSYGRTQKNKDPKITTIKFDGFVGGVVNPPGGFFNQVMTTGDDPKRLDKIRQKLAETPVFERLETAKQEFKAFYNEVWNRKGGLDRNAQLDSGLSVLVRAVEVFERVRTQLGEFMVTEVKLELQPSRTNRRLEFEVYFRGANFRSGYTALRNALDEDCRDPQGPFAALDQKIQEVECIDGTSYRYKLDIKEESKDGSRLLVAQPKVSR